MPKNSITITIAPIPEDTSPQTYAEQVGLEWDFVSAVKANRARSHKWGWCTVVVTAEFDGVTGEDSLGACSYPSRGGFLVGGYFPQMRLEAIANLRRAIADSGDEDLIRRFNAVLAKTPEDGIQPVLTPTEMLDIALCNAGEIRLTISDGMYRAAIAGQAGTVTIADTLEDLIRGLSH